MFKKMLASIVILGSSLLCSMNAHAEFQRLDYETPGDQFVALDHSVGVEWLRFNKTAPFGLSYVKEMGWFSAPDIADIHTLIEHSLGSSFVSIVESSFALTAEQKQMWFDLMGTSGTDEFGNQMSIGLVNGYMIPFDPNNWTPSKYWGIGVIGDSFRYIDFGDGYYTETNYGVWRASNGGDSLSSINNPMLNINNPNAPINQTPDPDPAPVSAPAFLSLFGLALLVAGRRRNITL